MENTHKQTMARIVSSNQDGPHKDLETIVRKYAATSFLRPIADHTKKAFQDAEVFIQNFYKNHTKEPFVVILDSGCGTGESTINLAHRFPNNPIIGIDKSALRLSHFQNSPASFNIPTNIFWVRAELLDFWKLALDKVQNKQWEIPYHALYYPNPWPKQSEATRRFHLHPIFPTMMSLASITELRTNWEIYAQEMALAAEILFASQDTSSVFSKGVAHISCEPFIAEIPETAFERKYKEARQKLWRVLIKKS